MKKIGIIGKGHRTETMLHFIRKTKYFGITGIYDESLLLTSKTSTINKLKIYDNPFALIQDSDLLFVHLTNDISINFVTECILNAKHVVIGNPVKLTLQQLEELSKLSAEASISVVPFLPYRFSACLLESKSYIYNPVYIEVRYKSVPEIKQTRNDQFESLLNIIDAVVNVVKAQPLRVAANSVTVVGKNPQVINAYIEFNNGCNVNLIADYCSNRNEFTLNVFQPMQIVTIDLLKNYALVKNFRSDNLFEYEATRPISSKEENPYAELLNYLNYFESFDSHVTIFDQFADTIRLYKDVEDKLL
jgi:hypothetical protein